MTLPLALGPSLVDGEYRSAPEDFTVDECPAFEASGDGEHLFLRIEKRAVDTRRVALDLQRIYGVADVDVSFAGMKDRHAVTRQWFSVRTPAGVSQIAAEPDRWRVIEWARHARKLRRGELARNRFEIRVKRLRGDVDALPARLQRLRSTGFPNYFGAQRFGHDGANLLRAKAWISHRRPRPELPAFEKALHLSTARAMLFNAVLARRVETGSWDRVIDGEVACERGPTGPLWGRGRSPASGDARAVEEGALAPHRDWLEPLEHLGLTQQRRPLVCEPGDLKWTLVGDSLELQFDLRPGSYATMLLRELGGLRDVAGVVGR